MSSSIITYPNLNKFIYYKNNYIKPVINTTDSAFYILTNTDDIYTINNDDTTNKIISIEVFAVGGGGAGGYYNGNGGDGGTVVYKSIDIKPNNSFELSVGKGAYYVTDNAYNNGFQIKIYEGFINDFFQKEKSYLMNMKPVDTINNGLNKIWEQKVNNITSLKTIIENDVEAEIISSINQNDICNSDPTNEGCQNTTKTMFLYNKGFTFNIFSIFFSPIDCTIEIDITAFKYAVLFFYSKEDIINGNFSDDLTLYQTFKNTYWMKVENETKIFKRDNIKANEQYYFKIIYSQDNELSLDKNKFNVNMKIITENATIDINNNTYFKFNNSIDNYGIVYSTPSTFLNQTTKMIEINASGGVTGYVNLDTVNYGKGGCSIYNNGTKKIKTCGNNSDGANGVKLPTSFNLLKTEPYNYTNTYGSGGGGAFWRLNGYGGKGGNNAGNGISFTNLPSISRPTINTGGGGGGNSFLNNYSEKMLAINKLSGANGIIIIKVSKKTEQILIQTFENKKDDIMTINDKIETIYKNNKLDVYTPTTFPTIINLNDISITNYKTIINDLLIIFKCLYKKLSNYALISEKERLKFPILIYYNDEDKDSDTPKNSFGNCMINIYTSDSNYSSEMERIKVMFNNKYYFDENRIKYYNFVNNNQLKLSDATYVKYFISKIMNDIVDKNNLVLFIENVSRNYFYYFKYSINIELFTNLYNLIVKNENKGVIFNNIKMLTESLRTFNSSYFKPIDKLNDPVTDTEISDRTDYVKKQKEYREQAYDNSVKLITSNNVTNFAISNFKAKYKLNKNNYIYEIIFYILIFIIFAVFYYTYAYFEDTLRPLVLIILLILIFLLISYLWAKATYDLGIFEKFTCNNSGSANKTITSTYIISDIPQIANCYTSTGNSNGDITYPYYFISNTTVSTDYVLLDLINHNILVDIFIYTQPYENNTVGSATTTKKYYEPYMYVYKNVLLPKNYQYKIYNNKIEKIDFTNNTTFPLISPQPYRNQISGNGRVYVNNCLNQRIDLCTIDNTIYSEINNKYTTYTYNTDGSLKTAVTTKTNVNAPDTIITEYYDFNPTLDALNKFTNRYINDNVLEQPFIVVKVINDMLTTDDTIEEVINDFKREMNLYEINTRLFLLNKNTKKIVNFTNDYEIYNQRQYAGAFIKNDKIYDREQQAYYILNREIMYNFYTKLLIVLIIGIILCCFLLYHYNNNHRSAIILLGFIAIVITLSVVLYKLFKHQHMDSDKYYFIKPYNYKNE